VTAGRRAVLKALAAAPLATLARGAEARDYASAAEVLGEIDRLEAELDARLAGLTGAAAALGRSVRADHARHRRARADVRRRLRLPAATEGPSPSVPAPTVSGMRALAQDLVHAYAEGMPALHDARAVDELARHMVDDARHLAILQMWMETEEPGA
jgi:hypothetical protein